jgi:mannose/cellobiose epimerase-like protein (N-acyl-D-glucosamine 2-epimerase family)
MWRRLSWRKLTGNAVFRLRSRAVIGSVFELIMNQTSVHTFVHQHCSVVAREQSVHTYSVAAVSGKVESSALVGGGIVASIKVRTEVSR